MFIPKAESPLKRLRWAPLALMAVVILAGIAFSFYVYTQIDRSGREHILERAATIAVAVPQQALQQLSGSEADLGTVEYESIKEFLLRMRSVNGDARFLYVMGKNSDGELFFYADSESAESPDYSPPGQIYYEATPEMVAVFEDARRRTEGPSQDRWGVWISGYAPVVDEAGVVIGMLGMDLPATRYISDALAYAMLPLLVAFLLLISIIAVERIRQQELRYVEQKTEFLSIASHEIRTPLTGIRWAIEGLLKRKAPPLDEKAQTILTLVHESCLGLIGRVNNLLDLTAIEGKNIATLRPEPIAIPAFLEDLVDSLTLSAQQRQVTIVLDDSVRRAETLIGDRQMLHHAFFNLLTNAIKYTRRGTAVTVSYSYEGGKHRVRIADQGNGVPEGEEERIFSGYHRTDAAVKSGAYGTGLGLYLVKKAAELHGGSVGVISTLGKGASFTVTLPDLPRT